MDRVYNFCAGPAALPTEVLQIAQNELLSWHNKGFSIMETSHRSDDFIGVATKAEQDLRDLLKIPNNYKVLFLQGGASLQFAQIALNFLDKNDNADYIETGIWSQKALQEAQRYGNVHLAYSAKNNNFTHIDGQNEWHLSSKAKYIHYASNETIGGLQFNFVPQSDKPLFVDMSSDILSKPINISDYGLIYAGAQKNIGPSGLVLVIIREDLLDNIRPDCPTMLNYKVQADNGSMYNTPPTLAWYLSGLVFEWLKNQGGVEAIYQANIKKAQLLYSFIDGCDFYQNPIAPQNRSLMNVPFTLKDDKLDKEFLKQAELNGLINLKGHRSVGGMRASIYNAIELAGVQKLVDFMADFAGNYS
jgi:phosphoserine aminotransferase